MSPRALRDPVVALLGVVVSEAWLALVGLRALWDAGDRTGLPTAAWLMPLVAALAPWVLPARTAGTRGRQAAVGQLGAVVGAGIMVIHPAAGVAVALAGITYAAATRR
ncbi:hypothetical protein GCM10027418_07800 [Mariniluteicoccus endophyticus]